MKQQKNEILSAETAIFPRPESSNVFSLLAATPDGGLRMERSD